MGQLDPRETVSGITVTLNAYTERRRTELDKVNADVKAYLDSLPEETGWDAIPIEKKAEFWKRKAAILWTFELPPRPDFFTSQDFEVGKLKETERLFTLQQIYL